MKPYAWMIDYTPQTEWIQGRGLLLFWAFFVSEIGAGLYVISLLTGIRNGALAGWMLCALVGGGLHMVYLGKPLRAWRAFMRPIKSELSRGLFLLGLFLVIGFIQIATELGFFGIFGWTGDENLFKILLTILGFFIVTHSFLTISMIGAIPFWNTGIMPLLGLISAVWLGSLISQLFALAGGNVQAMNQLETIAIWSLFLYGVVILFYLWSANHGSQVIRKSLSLLLQGDLSYVFYAGVLLLGLLLPVIFSIYIYKEQSAMNAVVLTSRLLCAFLGDLALRYCIFKAARYYPLIHSNILVARISGR